jgi:hypothetical protein
MPHLDPTVLLPVARPAIVTYLHLAHQLAIAQTDPRGVVYLATGFLQLYTKRSKDGTELNVDFYSSGGYHPECPFVEKIYETGDRLLVFGDSAVQRACTVLDSGSYVEALLDEYHVPGKAAYQKRPYLHQNLIYGYSRTRRLFFAQGFTDAGVYTNFTIGFDEFETASKNVGEMRRYILHTAGPAAAESLYDAAMIKTYLSNFINATSPLGLAHQVNPAYPLKDRASMLDRMKSRISGVPVYQRAYGTGTYMIAADLVEGANAKDIDIRPWCLFYEHKQQLLRLADYLTRERNALIDKEVLEELRLVETDFCALRNYLLDARLADRKVDVSKLRKNLRRLIVSETGAIAGLIEAIN